MVAVRQSMISRTRSGGISLLTDIVLAAALCAAVGAVIALDRRSKPTAEPPAVEPIVVEQPVDQPPRRNGLRIAVTPEPAVFDDVGRLLDSLGAGYAYRMIPLDDILDLEKIGQFDVLFLTCSGFTDTWLGSKSDGELRGGELYEPNPETFERAKQTLRKFVSDGGTLYASDLHLLTLEACFPEFYASALDDRGAPQIVDARVVDENLKRVIGERIELTFDQEGWRPAALAGEKLVTLLEGDYRSLGGETKHAPLLVRYPLGQGSVIFTSFHNEKQNSDKEKELLKFLVFSVVTASTDAEAERTLARGGFSRTRKDLFSASRESEPIRRTYENVRETDLQFVLAFSDQGAELELEVEGPDGAVLRKRGGSTISIDVPAAPVGSWHYRIRPISVPSDNFPFTISVGQRN
jgi:hypothetical protein